jgi:hypothetical protein
MLKRIISLLQKFFSKGGKLRNGRKVISNSQKLKRIDEFDKLLAQEGDEIERSYMKLDKPTRVQYLRDLKNGKISAKRLIAKLKARSITPIEYNLIKPFGIPLEIILPKISPKYFKSQNRLDAWNIFNNVKQKYNTFLKLGKNTDGVDVYTIKDFSIAEKDLASVINNSKQTKIGTNFNFGGVHGNGWADKGVDAKGKYVIFYDYWDLQPFQYSIQKIGKQLKLPQNQIDKISNWKIKGNEFWTKNKVYYDDAGNVYRSDGKTKLYSMNTGYSGGLGSGKPRVAADRVFTTKPLTREEWNLLDDEWDDIYAAGYNKSIAGAIGATGTSLAGLYYLYKWVISNDDTKRKKLIDYAMKNKLSLNQLNDKLKDKQLNQKLGFE